MQNLNPKIWMERYFHLVSDKMPHNGQIHFPSWETKNDVYQHYCSDMSQQQLVIIYHKTQYVSAHFIEFGHGLSYFPKVMIPEIYKQHRDSYYHVFCYTISLCYHYHALQENRFAKCVRFKLKRKEYLNKDQQALLRTKLQEYLEQVE